MLKFFLIASLTFFKSSSLILVIFSNNLDLSNVLICSINAIDFLSKPLVLLNKTWVGKFFLDNFEVIGITIVVGLYLFPLLFCITRTGLIPSCSLPIVGVSIDI